MTEQPWRRLDPRIIVTTTSLVFAPLPVTVIIMLISGARLWPILITTGLWVIGGALLSAGAWADWYYTWYRITEERFELRKGIISRNNRWIPRDRIRSVDLTADLAHRLFGLTTATIGTGQSGSDSELKLDGIRRQEGDRLREELLHSESTKDTSDVEPAHDGSPIATIKPAWFGYSMLTLSSITIVWGAIASAFGSLSDLLVSSGFLPAVAERFQVVPIWLTIVGGVVTAIAVGLVGALLIALEMWWGFTLTRENDTTLRVRRGLLTTRSVSLEERRLRGVEIAEPLLLRMVGGARTHAVATGLGEQKQGAATESKVLLPPAPRARAGQVAAAALREQREPGSRAALQKHPRAALRRRLVRALAAAIVIVAVPTVIPAVIMTVTFGVAMPDWLPLWAPWPVLIVALGIAIAVAYDAYRNLGHALDPAYLIARKGTGIRRTVALRRDGIIGWRFRQTLFQRPANLVSVAATTAAGCGVYEIPDVDVQASVAFADEAVPGLLTPFLEYD